MAPNVAKVILLMGTGLAMITPTVARPIPKGNIDGPRTYNFIACPHDKCTPDDMAALQTAKDLLEQDEDPASTGWVILTEGDDDNLSALPEAEKCLTGDCSKDEVAEDLETTALLPIASKWFLPLLKLLGKLKFKFSVEVEAKPFYHGK